MRKFALLQSACAVFLLAGLAHSQQLDFAASASTLFSSKPTSASISYVGPAEKGGIYAGGSADYIFKNHFGIGVEGVARAQQGLYNGYQRFRPVFYDVNAMYARSIREKTAGELMAGVGGERVLFYNQFSTCGGPYPTGCLTYVSSNHFLVHIGGGIRYYFWGNFFVRPEGHLYFIHNNVEFNSGTVGRAGVSVGYTFYRQTGK